MKDLSAGLMGILPAFLLWRLGTIEQCASAFFYASILTVFLCLAVFYILRYWHHPAVLTLLALGLPLMFFVYVAVAHPVFLPLFYAVAALMVVTGCVGALVTANWSWQGVAQNIAFLCSVMLLVTAIGSRLELVYIESGLLAAGAFGITRICAVDLTSWLFLVPRWICRGLEKIWY